MQWRRLVPYLAQGILLGVVVGVIAVWLYPGTPLRQRPVVEFKESTRPATSAHASDGAVTSYADAVAAAAPAVINVYTTKVVARQQHPLLDDPLFRRFFGDRSPTPRTERQNSLGSGVIVNEQGFILTNNHVIDGSDEILVALNDGRTDEAKVIGTDPESDLAVLKIAIPNLPTITIGSSDALRVGDVVLAIGNPFGVGQTVTQGIVSATGRTQLGISAFENFIQTDAAINPGNSGGALINAYGELVGINTAIFSRSGGSQGIGFAIPTSVAKNIMTQIIEHGQAIRGWLGIEIQTLSPALAESFGHNSAKGIVVAGVLRDGPAYEAGIKPGDIITKIDGEPVTDANTALNRISQHPPGSVLEIDGLRNGEDFSSKVKVGTRPRPQT